MGGSINIAARFNDGSAICVDGWTGFMSNMILNATTLSGDDAVVRSTLMKVAAHGNYDGPQPLRRSEYGIVVIDFVARRIHSMQSYASFDVKMALQLLDMGLTGWRKGGFACVLKKEAEGLLDAGRVTHVADGMDERDPVVLDRESGLALAAAEFGPAASGKGRTLPMVRIDMAPFELTVHPERSSLTTMKGMLRSGGFPLTVAEGLNAVLRS